jgi:predicted TIM-barrel fold metal-dependent hydrolase
MPGVDVLTQLGAGPWIHADGDRLERARARARFDFMGVASRRALAGDIAAGNAEVKEVLDANPQMRGWAVVNPAYPELSSDQMRRYCNSAQWLGALLDTATGGHRLASAAAREVLNAYRRYTKPILVHVGNEQAVSELEDLAQEFSSLKFVAAGAGGHDWQDCMLLAKRVVNIYLEPFSGGAHRGKLETILATLGPHRVLFASHFPEVNPGAALGQLVDAKLSDGEKQGILTTNAVRLFGLAPREG